jgi:hypothetical protein
VHSARRRERTCGLFRGFLIDVQEASLSCAIFDVEEGRPLGGRSQEPRNGLLDRCKAWLYRSCVGKEAASPTALDNLQYLRMDCNWGRGKDNISE